MSRRTVAVVGASADRRKFGNKSLRRTQRAGYQVFAVNAKGGQIEGLPAHLRLSDVPARRLDRVTVYLAPLATLAVLDEIAAQGCGELWLNPGAADRAVLEKAAALGLNAIHGCSIVDLGMSPAEFGDD